MSWPIFNSRIFSSYWEAKKSTTFETNQKSSEVLHNFDELRSQNGPRSLQNSFGPFCAIGLGLSDLKANKDVESTPSERVNPRWDDMIPLLCQRANDTDHRSRFRHLQGHSAQRIAVSREKPIEDSKNEWPGVERSRRSRLLICFYKMPLRNWMAQKKDRTWIEYRTRRSFNLLLVALTPYSRDKHLREMSYHIKDLWRKISPLSPQIPF